MRRLATALLVSTLTLGACSVGGTARHPAAGPTTTSSTAVTGAAPTTAAPSTTAVSGAAPTTAAPSTTAVPPTSAAGAGAVGGSPGRCRSSALRASAYSLNGATGSVGSAIGLTNVGGGPCTLYGYPGLQLLGPAGGLLPTQVIRGSYVTVPALPAQAVPLAPGDQAHFYYGYSEVGGESGACQVSSQVEVTPPNDFHYLVISLAIQPCGGNVWVSPVTRFCPAPLGLTAPTPAACAVPDLYVQAPATLSVYSWPHFPSTIRVNSDTGIEDLTWTAGITSAKGTGFSYSQLACGQNPNCSPPPGGQVDLDASAPAVCTVTVINLSTNTTQQVTTYLFSRLTQTSGGHTATLTAACS